MNKMVTHTTAAPQAIGTYSQAITAGNTVHRSSQVPLDPVTMELVSDDFRVQAEQVFHNLQAVAQAAGGSLADAVELTVYMTDLSHYSGRQRSDGWACERTLSGPGGGSTQRAAQKGAGGNRRRTGTVMIYQDSETL